MRCKVKVAAFLILALAIVGCASSSTLVSRVQNGEMSPEDLVRYMGEAGKSGRDNAIEAIMELSRERASRERIVSALIEMLEDQRWVARHRAAKTLGRIGDPRALGPLEILFTDPDRDVQEIAKHAHRAIVIKSRAAASLPATASAPISARPERREARLPTPSVPEWRSAGSGLLLRGTSHILTSLHVVDGAKIIRVSFPSGESYTGRVVARDANSDFAVLELLGMAARNEGFTVELGARIEVGEEVHAIGYPLGPTLSRKPSIVSGQVSAETGPRDNIAQFRMTAPINEGNSGGPLLNSKGVLIGIASAGLVQEGVEAIRFGTKVSAASLILSQAALARPFAIRVAPRSKDYTPQSLFREFSPYVVLVETK